MHFVAIIKSVNGGIDASAACSPPALFPTLRLSSTSVSAPIKGRGDGRAPRQWPGAPGCRLSFRCCLHRSLAVCPHSQRARRHHVHAGVAGCELPALDSQRAHAAALQVSCTAADDRTRDSEPPRQPPASPPAPLPPLPPLARSPTCRLGRPRLPALRSRTARRIFWYLLACAIGAVLVRWLQSLEGVGMMWVFLSAVSRVVACRGLRVCQGIARAGCVVASGAQRRRQQAVQQHVGSQPWLAAMPRGPHCR